MTSRVAVVGAGPSGLSALHAFEEARKKGADVPELVCFEKQSDWAGLWNYTWRTGLDEFGQPVHGSMYRYLWSNGPKECLEFADYTFDEHFGKPIPSFPPREVLHDYVTGRAKKDNLQKFIQFNTEVKWISYDEDEGTFDVLVESLTEGQTRTEQFDYVIVATGHFSTPNVPSYEGFEQFPGRIMHSHDFRDAREFEGRNLLVVGSSYSAEDVALQSKKYGAKSVTISYRSAPMGFPWPEGIAEVPLLVKLDGKTAHFTDGSTREVDAIVLCTGYLHNLSFIEESLRLRTSNVLYTPGLYKGVFWLDNPKLMYLSMQDQYYTFTLFDAEAWYSRDYVLGRIELPSRAEMADDIALWRDRQDKLSSAFEEIDFQADHMVDLLKDVDYPKFDVDLTRAHFKKWEHDKEESIIGYRDRGFSSPCTSSEAPVHHTPWWTEMDDSMARFLG
ncbi:MAG: SidA/IucD/PvdA family monooxygenase [Streptosporangiales bacterium]|nr:SidA/IucD/PvdA family monooxygenase [Streptosporangiales bacterium]